MADEPLHQLASQVDCRWLLASPGSEDAQSHMRIHIAQGKIQDIVPQPQEDVACSKLVLPALSNEKWLDFSEQRDKS